MTTRQTVVRRPAAARRVRTWARRSLEIGTLAAGAVIHAELQSVLEGDLGRTLGEYTVARSVIDISWGATTPVGTTEEQFAMGLVIAGRDAAAVGTTALPTPIQNPHADWFWYYRGVCDGGGIETSAGVFIGVVRHLHFDIRAMRKVQERDEVPVLVIERDAGGGNHSGFVHTSLLLLRS